MKMDNDEQKVIICGDLNGKFDKVFDRIRKLQKKGQKFDMMFCVGNVFEGESSEFKLYLNGSKVAPIQTYILGPNNQEQYDNYNAGSIDGFELCKNVTYLGKKGVFTFSNGLKIVYISGTESPSNSSPVPRHCYSDSDLKSLMTVLKTNESGYKGVDILLTSEWPKGVANLGNKPPLEKCNSCGSLLLSKFVHALKPRYHFAALEGVFYERFPYRNHVVLQEKSLHVSRFISLAPFGNKIKHKYLYAFSIKPMIKTLTTELNNQPEDTTPSPFEKLLQEENKRVTALCSNNYRWGTQANKIGNKRHHNNYNEDNYGKKKVPRPQNWSCWFCLGNDKVEKHLVASVGQLCYIAVAKGGLVPGHVLICPIAHHASSLQLPNDTHEEINKFKTALQAAFAANNQHCVMFERNYHSDHLQIQVVPVPQAIASDAIKESIIKCASRQVDRMNRSIKMDFAELPSKTNIKQVVSDRVPFFHVELPDGQRYFHKVNKYFPLQFGREILAAPTVLNIPQRINWRDCSSTIQQEIENTNKFREFFKDYDFTLSDDEDSDLD